MIAELPDELLALRDSVHHLRAGQGQAPGPRHRQGVGVSRPTSSMRFRDARPPGPLSFRSSWEGPARASSA